MEELLKVQTCPYCGGEEEDCHAVWGEGAEEEVSCNLCNRFYVVKPQYSFEGFLIESQCEQCGDWTDEGYKLCDCKDSEN